MRDNRLGGLALVIGAIAGLITMIVHPTGHHGVMSQQEMATMALLTRAVHGFAIASLPIAFLGALALTRQLGSPDRLSVLALVVYGFGTVAVMMAATMSGLVFPSVMQQLVAGDPLTETRRLFLDYTFRLNQAFASVFVVASCAAILLWSVGILRTKRLSAGLGIYGLVLGIAITVALFIGRLPLDVHGFGLVILTQAVWFIIAGVMLRRCPELPGDTAQATNEGL